MGIPQNLYLLIPVSRFTAGFFNVFEGTNIFFDLEYIINGNKNFLLRYSN
jgi:hypothetical protein